MPTNLEHGYKSMSKLDKAILEQKKKDAFNMVEIFEESFSECYKNYMMKP